MNKMQIKALANKIVSEVKDYHKKIRKENDNKIEKELNKNKDYKKVLEIFDKYNIGEYPKTITRNRIKSTISENLNLSKIKDISLNSVEDEIIIKTIESSNINEIVENIKSKYL